MEVVELLLDGWVGEIKVREQGLVEGSVHFFKTLNNCVYFGLSDSCTQV